MPHQHMPDMVIVQSVVEGKRNAARIAKETIDAFAREAFKENFRPCHQFAGLSLHKAFTPLTQKKPSAGFRPR
jgi:hypothetical protein